METTLPHWIPWSSWALFASQVIIVSLSVGPSVLLVVAHGLRYGFARSLCTIAGDLSANTVQIGIVVFGFSAIASIPSVVPKILQFTGAAYLAILGLRQWFKKEVSEAPVRGLLRPSKYQLFIQGFVVSLFNPKALLFYGLLFPLFLGRQTVSRYTGSIQLWSTAIAIDGIALLGYAGFAGRLTVSLGDARFRFWKDRVTGTLLLIGGVLLALFRPT